MLVIRFQRIGKKKQASFRVVLQERSWKPQGKIKELLGFYSPHSKEKKFQEERVKYWLSRGAAPSATVHNLFVDSGIVEGPKVRAWKPKKKKAAEKAEAPAEAKAEDTKEEEPKEIEKPAEEEVKPEEKPESAPEPTKTEEPAPAGQKESANS